MQVWVLWYEYEFTLNHANVRYFGHPCGINIHPLRTNQDCTTLWDYLEGLSPALHVLSLEQRHLKLQWKNWHKWFKVHPIHFGIFSTCQILEVLKIVGQHVMMPTDCAPLHNIIFKSYQITTDRLSGTSRPRIFCLNVYDCKKEQYVMLFPPTVQSEFILIQSPGKC